MSNSHIKFGVILSLGGLLAGCVHYDVKSSRKSGVDPGTGSSFKAQSLDITWGNESATSPIGAADLKKVRER